MRATALRARHILRSEEESVEAVVATILLVIITVALTAVIGVWLFTIIKAPPNAPSIDVSITHMSNRWSVPVRQVSDPLPLTSFRLIARHPSGDISQYDSDGDGTADTRITFPLEAMLTASADGPQACPLVLVDVNGNGKLDVGDTFVAYGPYFHPSNPLLDATRGYKVVSTGAQAIPRGSTLELVGSAATLGSADIHPGDAIKVEISYSGLVQSTVNGTVSGNGVFTGTAEVPANWTIGTYQAKFIVRPGAGDEWNAAYSFDVGAVAAISPAAQAAYDALSHPLSTGDIISLYYESSNEVVLQFEL